VAIGSNGKLLKFRFDFPATHNSTKTKSIIIHLLSLLIFCYQKKSTTLARDMEHYKNTRKPE